MKRIFITLAVALSSLSATAQQDYQLTHYMFDNLSFNPGYAGITKSICATMIMRQQWSGFNGGQGNPQTGLLNIHAPVKFLKGGLGLTYLNDQLGFEKNNIARLSYSYHLGIGVGELGIGVSAGIIQKSIKATWITPDGTPASSDDAINTGENLGNVSDIADLVPDFNFGLFYKTNNLHVGLSATHIVPSDMKELNLKNVIHYWVTAGYLYDINGDFKLRPSILAKSDGASTQIDINANVLWKGMVWGGLSYRLGDAIVPMAGYQTPAGPGLLRIGYGYDVTTSQLRSYSKGSHEIFLNYCFSLEKPPVIQKSKNPRFL